MRIDDSRAVGTAAACVCCRLLERCVQLKPARRSWACVQDRDDSSRSSNRTGIIDVVSLLQLSCRIAARRAGSFGSNRCCGGALESGAQLPHLSHALATDVHPAAVCIGGVRRQLTCQLSKHLQPRRVLPHSQADGQNLCKRKAAGWGGVCGPPRITPCITDPSHQCAHQDKYKLASAQAERTLATGGMQSADACSTRLRQQAAASGEPGGSSRPSKNRQYSAGLSSVCSCWTTIAWRGCGYWAWQ